MRQASLRSAAAKKALKLKAAFSNMLEQMQ